MTAITDLNNRLVQVQELIGLRERALRENPDDFVAQLARESLRAHVSDLQLQLHRAKLARSVEVVELHLEGRVARAGSLPLYLLSRISTQFADAMYAASQKLKSGRQALRISSSVVNMVDLRLADLAPGSTRLLVSGNVSPDLFGYSLFEHSLEETFELFSAPDDNRLASAVGHIGIRSARGIRDMLQTIQRAELELELSWLGPDAKERRWEGNYQSIARLSRALSAFQVIEPTRLSIKAEVVTVSARGRFELQGEVRTYVGTFGTDLLPQVADLRIGDEVSAVLERTRVINTVTQVEKEDYSLVAIMRTGQTRFRPEAAE